MVDYLAPNVVMPPTQADLPCDDGIPMETQRHKMQMDLLLEPLQTWLDARADGYVGGNMFVYYSLAQLRNRDFRGPDFFAVLGVPKRERRSWVVWEEGKAPDVVIELLSETTAELDKGEKKQIYQDQMRVSEYFWYDPFNPTDWVGFSLVNGVYEPIAPDGQERLVSRVMDLALMRWTGAYRGLEAVWLRWTTMEGLLLLTGQELAIAAQQQAEQATQQLRQVVLNLLQQNFAVEQVAQITGLSEVQVRQWAE